MYGSTSNAAEELINLTHLLFSARLGGGTPPVVEGGYLFRLHGPPQKKMLVYMVFNYHYLSIMRVII